MCHVIRSKDSDPCSTEEYKCDKAILLQKNLLIPNVAGGNK